jgi:hypothetical protein
METGPSISNSASATYISTTSTTSGKLIGKTKAGRASGSVNKDNQWDEGEDKAEKEVGSF